MDNTQLPNQSNEMDLWIAIKKGDYQSFHLLYMDYSDFLYNYGRKMCNDNDLIKDSIQDVFIIIWEKKDSISIKSSLKHYVFTIFRRELIQKIQYKKSLNHQLLEIDFDLSIESKIILEETQQQLRKDLDKAIKNLSHRQKEILFLRYYENMSYTEIAELMSLNKNSMYKLLSAAIQRLKRQFISFLIGLTLIGDLLSYLS